VRANRHCDKNAGMSVADTLGQLALFADLTSAQLEAVAHTHEEDVFAAGERVLRKGLSGGNFYVILEGEAAVELDGRQLARLGRGDFFGEISALIGDPPTADVVAITILRCLVIPGQQLERLLLDRPQLALRLLRMEARRLRNTLEWQP
jgi:CRP/FNR family transcriptional regulator, cyclic AMP receptor protein